ncbi:MAG: hypothetical protein MHMPM18_002044 [Marteilia pararefringens]
MADGYRSVDENNPIDCMMLVRPIGAASDECETLIWLHLPYFYSTYETFILNSLNYCQRCVHLMKVADLRLLMRVIQLSKTAGALDSSLAKSNRTLSAISKMTKPTMVREICQILANRKSSIFQTMRAKIYALAKPVRLENAPLANSMTTKIKGSNGKTPITSAADSRHRKNTSRVSTVLNQMNFNRIKGYEFVAPILSPKIIDTALMQDTLFLSMPELVAICGSNKPFEDGADSSRECKTDSEVSLSF